MHVRTVLVPATVLLLSGLSCAALAPPVGATTETLQYSCSGPGFGSAPAYTFAAVIDTDVPASVPFGTSPQIGWRTDLGASDAFRDWAVAEGFTTVNAGVRLATAVDGNGQPEIYQPVPATGVPKTSFWAWQTAPTSTVVAVPSLGQHALTVQTLGVTVAFSDAAGPRLATSATCVLAPATPAGHTVIDVFDVVAATSTTTVTVSGDTAQATVISNGIPPTGTVSFAVSGKSVTAGLRDGKAAATLPDVLPGAHQVIATFVPDQPAQLASSTATATYVVPAITTRTEVSAVYAADRDLLKARARVTAARVGVSGRVTFVLKRNGRTLAHVTVRMSSGAAVKIFRGITETGRYVLVAKYRASSTYQQSSDRVRLRVP